MRPLLLLLSFSFCSSFLFAQKEVPAFGKIDKADLEMKDCAFDKAAEAMVLFDVAEVYCDLNINNPFRLISTQLQRHVRIKVLNQKGSDVANIHIPYLNAPGAEDIKNIAAQTINLDASGNIVITKVEKEAIFRKKINKRYSEVIFTFPEVRPGCIIEYKFKDDANDLYGVKNWYFQRSIPVAYSQYVLDFPRELIITANPKGRFGVKLTEKSSTDHLIKTFSLENVPALRDEPYITCDEDYLQQVTPQMLAVEFTGQPSHSLVHMWPQIIKDLMEDDDFGVQLKKNIPRTADLDAALSGVKDPYKKMVTIHEYVKKNMEWNETYGIWALDGVKSAWRDKKGTAGEINLILVNLLKDADLDAHAVLVSSRSNGRVNTTIADINQFDKVMAYLKLNGRTYVLDATDKYTPSNLIPYSVLNSEGLVIEKPDSYAWGWRTLWNEDQLFNNRVYVNAVIDEQGNITGEAEVTSKDYSRLERMKKLKEGREKFSNAWLQNDKNPFKIDSLLFENENIDSLPLIQKLHFENKVSSSGGYNYFSANLFAGFDKNPFIGDDRFSDIFFGANQIYNISASFFIPQDFQFETLPKNLKMIMPDTSIVFIRTASVVDNNMLIVKLSIEFRQPYYLIDNYDYFKEFYKKMFELLNEQFVYKKK